MCFYPGMGGAGGGLSGFLIPVSQTGEKLSLAFKPLVWCHFILSILELVCAQYASGAFDLIISLIGMYVIRNPDGYGMQSLCCYIVGSAIIWIWDFIRPVIYWSGNDTGIAPGPNWQYYLFAFVITALPFILVAVVCVGWFIRKDLNRSIEEMQDELANMLGQGQGQGGGGMQQQQAGGVDLSGPYNTGNNSSGGSNAGGAYRVDAPAGRQQPAPSGFRAFQGSGNRLGGS